MSNLSQFVKKRNGVSMGASHSMRNMLRRSLGAGSFREFWRYWNPIWGYYLGRYIYLPLRTKTLTSLALLLTFLVSGFLHDLAIMLFRQQPSFKLSFWFLLMGNMVLLSEALSVSYSQFPLQIKAMINLSFIGFAYFIASRLLMLML